MNLMIIRNVSLRGGADGRLRCCENSIALIFASQYHFKHLKMYSSGKRQRGGEGRGGETSDRM